MPVALRGRGRRHPRGDLRVAADRISPSAGETVFAGAPWDMGFHDGKAVAADALRLMARQL